MVDGESFQDDPSGEIDILVKVSSVKVELRPALPACPGGGKETEPCSLSFTCVVMIDKKKNLNAGQERWTFLKFEHDLT